MRTDSTRLSNVFIEAAHDFIVGRFGKEYWGKYKIKNDENSQDAHCLLYTSSGRPKAGSC